MIFFKKKLSNGAPVDSAPLLVKTSNGALSPDAPLLVLKKIVSSGAISDMNTNDVPIHGAPLLYSSRASHLWCAINVHISYSPFFSSATFLSHM